MTLQPENISLTPLQDNQLNLSQKIGLILGFAGLFILTLAFLNINFPNKTLWLASCILSVVTGIVVYANGTYLSKLPGISNNGVFLEVSLTKVL